MGEGKKNREGGKRQKERVRGRVRLGEGRRGEVERKRVIAKKKSFLYTV